MPETLPPGADIVCALLLGLTGLALVVVGRRGSSGKLRRNAFVGIRTTRSMESDESWHTMHRVAAPWTYLSGGAPMVAAVAVFFVRPPAAFLTVVFASLGLLLVFLCVGVWRGTRALTTGRAGPEGA